MIPKVSKWDATRMPNDTLLLPELTTSAPQIAVNCKTHDIETASGHQRTSMNLSKEVNFKSKAQQSKVKGPSAWAKPWDDNGE